MVSRRGAMERGGCGAEEQDNMGTNYPESTASHEDGSPRAETHAEWLGGRVIHRLRHMVCALHGHDTLLQFEQGRLFLRCVSCGHETPGWELNETPPIITARTDGHRRTIVQP